MASRLQKALHRVGFELIRFPSPRLRSGHTMQLVRTLSIDCILDVGANVGQYGEFLRSIGYRGTIVSFEPLAGAHAALADRAANDPDWRTGRTALGDRDHEATIHVSRASVMASLRPPSSTGAAVVGADLETVGQEAVPVRRLDAVFDQHVPAGAKVFLKMAVQGATMDVLRGASGCIDRIAAIQTIVPVHPLYEGMPDWLEVLTHLRDLGFEPTGFFPVLYYGELRVSEFDAVMIRPDRPFDA